MAGDPELVRMTVLRDGYFNGQYARPGFLILVEAKFVEPLEVAGFASRAVNETAPQGAVSTRLDPSRAVRRGLK